MTAARRSTCPVVKAQRNRPAGPVFEALEARRLLDGAEVAVIGFSPAIDPTVRDTNAEPAIIEPAAAASAYPLDQTFLLHSNPSASKVIYLDFDGHTTTGLTWNNNYGDPIVTPAFSFEGDSSFSDNELTRNGPADARFPKHVFHRRRPAGRGRHRGRRPARHHQQLRDRGRDLDGQHRLGRPGRDDAADGNQVRRRRPRPVGVAA